MLSTYLQGHIRDWLRGTTMPAAPGTIYLSLHTGDPGANGANEHGATASYAREAVTLDGSGDVAADVEFDEATANYSADISHIGISDASSAGNFLVGGPLTAAKTISSGDTPRVKANAVQLLLDKE